MAGKFISKEKEKEIIKKYNQGFSYREIGENARTIKRVLSRNRLKPRKGSEAVKTQWIGEKGKIRRKIVSYNSAYRVKTSDGYYRIKYAKKHNRKDEKGRVLEHIIIAEDKIGRKLKSNECVHHINGIRTDNNPKNLKVLTYSKHATLHRKDRKIDKNGRFIS